MTKTIKYKLNLKANPFEHYAAETEPNIARYAVRPPYLATIVERNSALGSFILFGDRGAGKSATRITVFNDLWERASNESGGNRHPLTVNVTDFSTLLPYLQKGTLDDKKIVQLIAFAVIEQSLIWFSSLPEEERAIYLEGINNRERARFIALIEEFYSPVPEMDRKLSSSEAFRLLNAAWTTKSTTWLARRWDPINKIISSCLAAILANKTETNADVSKEIEEIISSLKSVSSNTSRSILNELVELSKSLGFSGICVLLDKLDETHLTTNSAESTAELVYPILAHIQLLEVPGFAWTFFLWSNVQSHFQGEKLTVRLDKITHANITWNELRLREMLDARIAYFSDGKLILANFFEPDIDFDLLVSDLIKLAIRSPREIIRLFDMIIREHDSRGVDGLITENDVDNACDKYCTETIGTWYKTKLVQQVLRLGLPSFVNKDVQSKFKIGDQGARNKIKLWEEAGLVRQDGTVPSELGGKPVNRYSVSDPRIVRIIERKLDDVVGAEVDDE